MKNICIIALLMFLLLSCSNNSSTGPRERGTFDLTIRNLTNEPDVCFYIRNYYFSEAGWCNKDSVFLFLPIKAESTRFYSYGVVVDVYEDTIINTVGCDSVLWNIGQGILIYYE